MGFCGLGIPSGVTEMMFSDMAEILRLAPVLATLIGKMIIHGNW